MARLDSDGDVLLAGPAVRAVAAAAEVVLLVGPRGRQAPAGREEAEPMAASNQICEMDTAALARHITARELGPVEAVDQSLSGWTGWTRRCTCSPRSCPTRPGRTPSGSRLTLPLAARSDRSPGSRPG